MTDPNAAPAAQPAPAAPGADPGKTLGIVGLVLSILAAIVGLIISIVAFNKSKKAGFKNVPALVGIIIGILGTIGWIVFWGVIIAGGAALFGGLAEICAELGPGVHEMGGVTYTCG